MLCARLPSGTRSTLRRWSSSVDWAGGHLALWAAARGRLPKESPLALSQPLPIAGVVTLAGINDLRAFREKGPSLCGGHPTIDKMTGAEGRSGQNVYADTSPADLLPIGVPQIVASGELDVIVSASFGRAYAAAAAASGDRVEILDLLDAGHFDLIDPKSSRGSGCGRRSSRCSMTGLLR